MMDSKQNICRILRRREISNKHISFDRIASSNLGEKHEQLYRKDLYGHYGCINAVEFSGRGELLTSGGDDRRVLLWHTYKALHNNNYKPIEMSAQHLSNIFSVSFDNTSNRIFSAGNDDQVILHDIQTKKMLDIINHEQPVYCVSMDPSNNYVFATAGDDGRILIFDSREDSVSSGLTLTSAKSAFHSVMYNPVEPRLLATANAKEGSALWDVRITNKEMLHYGGQENCMCIRWNKNGSRLVSLRRRKNPLMYGLNQTKYLAEFYHNTYLNTCTMKTGCFAGYNDEYILTGSDDFNLYMWKVPSVDEQLLGEQLFDNYKVDGACNILRGHRSIVNQVRFHSQGCLIASSGVEKIIKLWSPIPLPFSSKESKDWIRRRYTHDEYISLLLSSGQFMNHDYSSESIEEDAQMMAFFDSLVQRETEGTFTTDESSPSETDDDDDPTFAFSDCDSEDEIIQPVPVADDNNFNVRLFEKINTTDHDGDGIATNVKKEEASSASKNGEKLKDVNDNDQDQDEEQLSQHHVQQPEQSKVKLPKHLLFIDENDDEDSISSSSCSSSSSSSCSSSSDDDYDDCYPYIERTTNKTVLKRKRRVARSSAAAAAANRIADHRYLSNNEDNAARKYRRLLSDEQPDEATSNSLASELNMKRKLPPETLPLADADRQQKMDSTMNHNLSPTTTTGSETTTSNEQSYFVNFKRNVNTIYRLHHTHVYHSSSSSSESS